MPKRCVILAVDDPTTVSDAITTISDAMNGPIEPYMASVKFNDALHAPYSHDLIAWVNRVYPKLGLMVDGKLADVLPTCKNTLHRYSADGKGILATISAQSAGPDTFTGLREGFPKMLIAAMGVPTDWTRDQCVAYFGMTPPTCMRRWLAAMRKFVHKMPQGAIASYDMLGMMGETNPDMFCVTPGIRDEWMLPDHQKRITGAYEALMAGSRYLVMGAQLTKGSKAKGVSVEKSQQMTADRINAALRDLRKAG